ncbi:hypothetical protein PV08_06610 [Exophiala spinifera]|uniref:DNA polymerase epsilon subunit B n=1 Tax=Exophiala spinifera TaxID=91928 RepID=A0A0D2B548_9EURO|nr:uncharacterized protein PV08_06610 [Exophiala spinifera]KIW13830.1 hypothetical protein PV08_06610 [Exophiala spinifera]
MEEPVSTPRLPAQALKPTTTGSKDQLLSSSPGFGTPAYPVKSRPPTLRQPFAAQLNTASTHNVPTVLPILLPPQTLRSVAFRTLTKKHNLTLTSSGLGLLSTFIGKFCGSGWREEGLAERVLDEIAKTWKRNGGGLIIEDGPDKKLSNILKTLEPCMSGGRLDTGKLSRTNSSGATPTLPRSGSLVDRPDVSREDSQASLGISGLNVEESDPQPEEGQRLDVRTYLKVISAFEQPRLVYSTTKKTLETAPGTPSLLPPIQHKTAMFRNRYHLVHQRLMRNESFQAPSFTTSTRPPSLLHSGSSAATLQQAYKITPISNLLGRSGSSHLLLGMLVYSAAGDVALTDLSGSVTLDLSMARPVPADGAWFCPGMIVLVEGTYEEDGSHGSNLGTAAGVGGQIKGRFVTETMAGPPAERRSLTIGSSNSSEPDKINIHTSVGASFGWIDFLGVGSEKGIGAQMRRLQRRLYNPSGPSTSHIAESSGDNANRDEDTEQHLPRTKIAILAECTLDSPRVLEAIRAILSTYNSSATDTNDLPLSVVLMGNFVSTASMAGGTKGGSVEYKEAFDALASVMAEFPFLLGNTTFVFVPGDNDPWASSFSGGGACALPRLGVPEVFTSRIRRVIAGANSERKDKSNMAGDAVWSSNPARLSLFGPLDEIVLFRDDITGRLRRNAVTLANPHGEEDGDDDAVPVGERAQGYEDDVATGMSNTLDKRVHEATSHIPGPVEKRSHANTAHSTHAARKLIKTVLDQSHLAPFAHSIRPVFWDHAGALSLYPLPTALVLADAEMPGFAITYEGCHVMNPGRIVDELGMSRASSRGSGVGRWIEFDVQKQKGEMREVRF